MSPAFLPLRRALPRVRHAATRLLALATLGAAVATPAPATLPPEVKVPICGSGDLVTGPVRLLEGLGEHRFGPSATDPVVRRWFEQGLMLAWGFDFTAAQRAFEQAIARDPGCAICWWGLAYALGPSVNHDIDAATVARARVAIERAVAAAGPAPVRERALIAALRVRYPVTPSSDAGALPTADDAYAQAMAAVARAFPRDADVQALYADALMTPHGRSYWRKDGQPEAWTPAILAVAERALTLDPRHPGAAHLHVHALEDAPMPQRAAPSADLLRTAAPGVPHLLHMPSHVDLRLGRFAGAIVANRQAIALDAARAPMAAPDPAYQRGYADHNLHFLWFSAMAGGLESDATTAAATLAGRAAASSAPDGTLQHWALLPAFTALRFGRWDEALRVAPPVRTAYVDAMVHYVRAVALLRAGDPAAAATEATVLSAATADPDRGMAGQRVKHTHPLQALVALADLSLQAERASAAGRHDDAIRLARAAVAREDALDFDEPPAWHAPTRRLLGDVLARAGRRDEAAAAYRAELHRRPATAEVAHALDRLRAGRGGS